MEYSVMNFICHMPLWQA